MCSNRPSYHAVLILALVIRKEKLGLLEGMILEILEERLSYSVT
jgi:hypothetical protein